MVVSELHTWYFSNLTVGKEDHKSSTGDMGVKTKCSTHLSQLSNAALVIASPIYRQEKTTYRDNIYRSSSTPQLYFQCLSGYEYWSLLSTSVYLGIGVAILVPLPKFGYFWVKYFTLPLLVIFYHILRLWPRKYWLVIWEVLYSFGEVAGVAILVLPDVREFFFNFGHGIIQVTIISVLQVFSAFAMSTCIMLSLLFLLCDILRSSVKQMLCQYNFSAGLRQPGHQWNFVYGNYTMRKRFSSDSPLMRCIRGGIAIILLLTMLFLAIYVVVCQPVQENSRTGIKIFKVLNRNLGALGVEGGVPLNLFGPLRVFLLPQDSTGGGPLYQHPTMTLRVEYPFSGGPKYEVDCQSKTDLDVVLAECFDPLAKGFSSSHPSDSTFDVTMMIHFPQAFGDFRVYLGVIDSVGDILGNTDPTGISPGLNLHGRSPVSVKERFSSRGAATFGLPKYEQLAIVNIRGISPDLLPLLPRNNHTATLRVSFSPQRSLKIEQEFLQNSVLNGLALLGGIWTLVNGMFALVFGSTLLLVLCGIKPLSIYGLIHSFRQKKESLVDGNYTLSPEERDRTVGMLREHLLDVEAGEDGVPSQHLPLGIAWHIEVGTQT